MIDRKRIKEIEIVSFDAPNGNLLSLTDLEDLNRILLEIKNEDLIKGVIFTGNGRSFCTGLDNSTVLDQFTKEKSNHFFKFFDQLLIQIFTFPKPTIAAVNGHSIGGGLLIQCCTDYVFISDNSKIKLGFPELKLGLTIDLLMTSLLRFSVVDKRIFKTLLLNAQYINNQDAYNIGLVDEIVAEAELVNSCVLKIQDLIKYSPNAYKITKEIMKNECRIKMEQAFNEECYTVFAELLSENII